MQLLELGKHQMIILITISRLSDSRIKSKKNVAVLIEFGF